MDTDEFARTVAEVGVSGRHVLQALAVTPVIVVFDERLDRC